jgi:drug/metabolite transporter (DMT)-like permease
VVAVAGAQLAYFNALAHVSVGVALMLEYQGIVLVVGWLWLRHGRRPRPLMLAGAGLALVGLALVLDLFGGLRLDGVGVLWGLTAAVGLAVYFVVASDGPADVPALALSCAGLWIGAVGLVVAALARVVPVRAATTPVVLLGHHVTWVVPVLGLALVAAALAYVVGTAGARLLGATLASFVGLTEVVFAVLFAWLLLGQLPGPLQITGGVVVLAGIALVRADELRRPVAVPASPLDELPPDGENVPEGDEHVAVDLRRRSPGLPVRGGVAEGDEDARVGVADVAVLGLLDRDHRAVGESRHGLADEHTDDDDVAGHVVTVPVGPLPAVRQHRQRP